MLAKGKRRKITGCVGGSAEDEENRPKDGTINSQPKAASQGLHQARWGEDE